MELYTIKKHMSVNSGEYVFHVPTQQIVMCGNFNAKEDYIQALGAGRLVKDKIENFKKIHLTKDEHHKQVRTRCKGCGGKRA